MADSSCCLEWDPSHKFYCGLPDGHAGQHRSKNDEASEPWDVSWPNVCPRCGQPMPKASSHDGTDDA